MTNLFGEYQEQFEDYKHYEFLAIGYSPSSLPLSRRWKKNGIIADFVADYIITYFPENSTKEKMQNRIKDSVNYIANELLENAMKFNEQISSYPIKFKLHLFEDTGVKVVVTATNSICQKTKDTFQAFIQELLASDPEDFYLVQLERSAEAENAPGIGLITIINDYNAKIGWKFETLPKNQSLIIVTTMVKLEYNLQGLLK